MDKISELMDGELDEHQARRQVVRVARDASMRETWEAFHLIGDVMRGEQALSGRFGDALSERLSREPTVLAPRRGIVTKITNVALPVAASIAAVAAVGWVAFFNNPLAPSFETAKAPVAPAAVMQPSAQLASVPSDGKMNEYLFAHQEFSPSTAIQGLAPYIRSVSTTQPAPGQ